MAEFEKRYHKNYGSSGVAKAGMITGITGATLGLLNGVGNGGGLLGGLFGAPANNAALGLEQAALTAGIMGLMGGLPQRNCGPVCDPVTFQGGFVTEKELGLTREIAGKDSEIARLQAEKYTDQAVAAATMPLMGRVCELEKQQAVNAARDHDFRHFVDREYVHQPKARINESIVTCRQCGCECRCDDRC